MDPNINVTIPDKCYVSPDRKRVFPFTFFFSVTYGYIPSGKLQLDQTKSSDLEAVKYPQITISGFEQLLSAEKINDFIDSLTKSDDDWKIQKSTAGSNILIRYVGDHLAPDFCFSAFTDNFISDAANNNEITLTAAVENFQNIKDHSYIINTKVDYIPWAKSITFDKNSVSLNSKVEVSYAYDGDVTDQRLFQNGVLVDTARSPFTAVIDKPSLFLLEVFNQTGQSDMVSASVEVEPPQIIFFKSDKAYFTKDRSVCLNWYLTSASGWRIDNLNKDKDIVTDTSAVIYPRTDPGARTTSYTLSANGYKDKKPYSVSASVTLTQTYWRINSSVSGYFSGSVYGNTDYNSRIFLHEGKLYSYAHPKLYQSTDGSDWTEFSNNSITDNGFCCIAADYYDHTLYAMGRQETEGRRLYITMYDFQTSVWSYASAFQLCNSNMGGFAFSPKDKKYVQVLSGGLMIVKCDDMSKWNAGSSMIKAVGTGKVISGDYCFFKNTFYAVMLCDNKHLYVYDCDKSMQEVLFSAEAGKDDRFVSLVQTENRLYLLTGSLLIDVKTQEVMDPLHPPLSGDNRPWIGVNNSGRVIGIFPDKNLWTFDI